MFEGLRTVFSKETLLLPIYCFALCKLLMKDKMNSFIILLCSIPIAFLLSTTILLSLIIFGIWHEIVHWYLTLKYGSQYYKIVTGADATFICPQRHLVQSVTMIEASKSPKEILTYSMEKCQQMMDAHPKLKTIIQYELGYHFHKFIDVDIRNIVKLLSGYKDVEEFRLLMDELASKPMPMDDTLLWEFYIGETPINWPNEHQHVLQIPIIVRAHHLLGDGISITTLITCYMLDDGIKQAQNTCKHFNESIQIKFGNPAKPSVLQNISNKMKKLWELSGRNFVLNAITNPESEHILHGVETGNKKIAAYLLDTEDGHYLKKIKSIKKKHQNTLNSSFTDIVFTALAASLKDYVEAKKDDEQNGRQLKTPKEINCFNIYYLNLMNFNELIEMKNDFPVVKLSNKYVPIMNKIPLGITNGETETIEDTSKKTEITKGDMLLMLNKITKQNGNLFNSLDLLYSSWIVCILLEVLPFPLIRSIMKNYDGTAILSNFPGYGSRPTRKVNGCLETDTLLWTVNYGKAGITVLFFSHYNRLRISLLQDCNVIKTRQEGERILDGIFKYIDMLDDE